MNMKWRTWLCVGVAVLAFGAYASAATISNQLVYVQSWTPNATNGIGPGAVALGQLDLTNPTSSGTNKIHEFKVVISLGGLAADQDFWLTTFNVNLSAGLEKRNLTNGTIAKYWKGVSGSFSSDIFGGTLNYYANGNADIGSNTNDLLNIAVEAQGPDALSRQYGESSRPYPDETFIDSLGYPTEVGRVYVKWLSGAVETISLTAGAGATGDPWGIITGNSEGAGANQGQPIANWNGGAPIQFGLVPEPATLGLLAIGSLLMISRRRA
jgi:hypothetical protein